MGQDRHCRCFGFEADFTSDLRCIPMAVRRKLDLAGVKLKLSHWHALGDEERLELLHWPDDTEALQALHERLMQRTASMPAGQASPLPAASGEAWQQQDSPPEVLLDSCRQLGLRLRDRGWTALDELQRFALIKLSHPGHEHRNLPSALQEFGLIDAGQ